jgi:hypothetical protein
LLIQFEFEEELFLRCASKPLIATAGIYIAFLIPAGHFDPAASTPHEIQPSKMMWIIVDARFVMDPFVHPWASGRGWSFGKTSLISVQIPACWLTNVQIIQWRNS